MILSSVFKQEEKIPKKYTAQGKDINPPLYIEEMPKQTKSLALIVDDPDAPKGLWTHWVVFNISPQAEIQENSIPGLQGLNSWNRQKYGGPNPPSGTHRYFFKIYALDVEKLNCPVNSTQKQLEQAMEGHILAKAELMGLYSKDG